MSAVLLIIKDKKQVAKVAISTTPFVLGRAPQCHLVLDEPYASRQHAEILRQGGHFYLVDKRSRNGTFVNGQRVCGRLALKDGDEVAIGGTRLKFVCEGNFVADEFDPDATRFAPAGQPQEIAPAREAPKEGQSDIEVKLRVVLGPLKGEVFRNWKGPLTIGRAPDNTVPLLAENSSVSAHHAQILSEGDRYYIEDLGSTNGTFLNNAKVHPGQRQPLKHGDKIRVGTPKDGAVLVFERVDLRRRRKTRRLIIAGTGVFVLAASLIKIFQPEDVAGNWARQGWERYRQGDLTNAHWHFSNALSWNGRHEDARRGKELVEHEFQLIEELRKAEKDAQEDRFDSATNRIQMVLAKLNINSPTRPKATELLNDVQSMQQAHRAKRAQNWDTALALLQKVHTNRPHWRNVASELEHTRNEHHALSYLRETTNALTTYDFKKAKSLLESIPATSVYAAEAQKWLPVARVYEYLHAATTAYESAEGSSQVAAARQYVALAKKELPAHSREAAKVVQEWEERIAQVLALCKDVEDAEASLRNARKSEAPGDLSRTNAVEALVMGWRSCSNVAKSTIAPQGLRRRASTCGAQIQQLLETLARDWCELGDKRSNEARQTTDVVGQGHLRRQAWSLYVWATKASSNYRAATEAARQLSNEVYEVCRNLWWEIHRWNTLDPKVAESNRALLKVVGFRGIEFYDGEIGSESGR